LAGGKKGKKEKTFRTKSFGKGKSGGFCEIFGDLIVLFEGKKKQKFLVFGRTPDGKDCSFLGKKNQKPWAFRFAPCCQITSNLAIPTGFTFALQK
jgi:hypothetical protein